MTEFNGFKGAAVRLDDIDIPRIGSEIGVGEDEIHAFMDVEAAGSGFDGQGRPKILFEPHVFYRNLTGKKRDEAVKQGLAYSSWGEKPYPKDSYPRLIMAMAIDETAAIKATSWGLTQILGENCKGAGYATPQAMVLAFMADEENHLAATVSLLKHMGIADDLKAHAWAVVARVWNGPGYRKNKYDTKMAAAYAKWAKVRDTPFSAGANKASTNVDTASGKTDRTTVRVVQERLKELGYTEVGNPDGKMGKLTKTAILAFRNENDLPVSDVIDDALLQALDGASPRSLPRNDAEPAAVRQAVPEVQSNFLTKVGAGTLAGTLATGSVTDLASKAEGVRSFISPWKEMFSDIPSWAWLGCGALVLVAIMMIARRGELKGIEAFQAGERR
ncbi:Peptidoglycan-binding domain 1 protein [Neorhizobium galegae bv. officinalis bv. officinalis str. HAMBI 1141]|uniref:Peptidoglycan-binding domain 1 protein n=1 Tax=Neorhizobium galegae bv. officinalis bv. officinalis str. HAMBI 1141 TaxID=1028801 RepID=A0A068T2C3_NEOGA|nr:N-acetylmuramidase domain-containing protein [Neorhizobium galegae]CDN52548.1 Peptidoglycan-binding domain 1 protein [Neorhizobium galegae bv. officinalis bv. officinalis str. HAMBI 1141]